MNYKRTFYTLFSVPCCECREVEVLFWQRRCSFCEPGSGLMPDEVVFGRYEEDFNNNKKDA